MVNVFSLLFGLAEGAGNLHHLWLNFLKTYTKIVKLIVCKNSIGLANSMTILTSAFGAVDLQPPDSGFAKCCLVTAIKVTIKRRITRDNSPLKTGYGLDNMINCNILWFNPKHAFKLSWISRIFANSLNDLLMAGKPVLNSVKKRILCLFLKRRPSAIPELGFIVSSINHCR